MATELAKAYVQIVPSAQGLGNSLTEALTGDASEAGTSAGGLFGGNMISKVTSLIAAAGIGKMLSDAINEGMDFDVAMSQVAATMGTTTDQIQELRDYAKEMGATTAFSATEAAEGLNTLAMAGLDANEQMEVLPTVLNLASAGAIDLDSAASYVTASIKGFGDEMDNAEYYADLMAKGATMANTNVNDLGEALSGTAATASSYGQEADSVTLSLLRLAEQNVTGSEATTGLSRAMADIYTPTDAAKQAMEELGVASYDANGNARDFNDVVDDLNGALSNMSQEEANAYKDTIFTTNGLKTFNKMCATSSDKVDEFKDGLSEMSGSAAQQAATQLDNLSGDVTLFNSAVSGAQIAVSDALAPALRKIVEYGTDAISAFTEGFNQGGLNGVLSAGADIINSLAQGITNHLPTILDQGLAALSEFIAGLGGNVGEILAAGINLITSLVTSIVGAIPTLQTAAWDAILGFIDGVLDSLPDVIAAGVNLLVSLGTGLIQGIPQLISNIPTIIANIKDKFINYDWSTLGETIITTIKNGIDNLFDVLPGALKDIATSAYDFVTGVNWVGLGSDIIRFIGNGVSFLVTHVPDLVKDIAQNAYDLFSSIDWLQLGKDVITFIGNGLQIFFNNVGNKLQEIGENAKELFSSIDWLQLGKDLISFVVNGMQTFFSNIGEKLQAIGENAVRLFQQIDWLQLGSDVINFIINGLESLFSNIGDKLKSIGENAVELFKEVDWVQLGSDVINFIINGIENLFSNIGDKLKSVGEAAVEAFKEIDWLQLGKDIIDFIIDGIEEFFSNIGDKLQEVGEAAVEAFKDIDWLQLGKDIIKEIKNGILGIGEDAVGAVKNVGSKISTGWNNFWNGKATEDGEEVVEGIAEGIEGDDSAESAIVAQADEIESALESEMDMGSPSRVMQGEGQNMIAGLTNGLQDADSEGMVPFEELHASILLWGTELSDSLEGMAERMIYAFNRGFKNLPDDSEDVLDDLKAYFEGWGTDMESKSTTTAANVLKDFLAGIKSLPKEVQSILDSTMNAVIAWGTKMQTQAMTIGKNFVTSVYNGMSDLASKVKSRLDAATDKVTSWKSTMDSKGESIGESFVKNVYSGMSTLASQVKSRLSDANDAISNYSSTLYSTAKSSGENIGQGLIDGMASKLQGVISKAQELGREAVKGINSGAGVSSPSKYTIYTGQMVDEGLVKGITDYAYKVDKAVEDVMQIVSAQPDTELTAGVRATPAYATVRDSDRQSGGINVTQNIYSEAKTAAALMREARYQQQRAVLMGVSA